MSSPSVQVLCGDIRETLATLDDESVNCCVTSPPYFGLRNYGSPDQIGLESTPDEYVETLVAVFREVRRVLHPSGTVWLNLGDSYAGSWGNQGRKETRGTQRPINAPMLQNLEPYPDRQSNTGRIPEGSGLKPKDLIGIPWMVAFALRSDGWICRSDVVWAKPNPMPESVTDRPTRSHEYIFLLTKSARYYYDAAAIREPLKESSLDRINQPTFDRQTGGPKDYAATGQNPNRSMRHALESVRARADKQRGHGRRHAGFNDRWDSMTREEQQAGGANKRTVWTVATRPYPGAHFATFSPELIEPCILAGCPVGGTVLDPFAGSGTTLAVALKHGRNAVGIELNPSYVQLIHERLRGVTVPLPLEEQPA